MSMMHDLYESKTRRERVELRSSAPRGEVPPRRGPTMSWAEDGRHDRRFAPKERIPVRQATDTLHCYTFTEAGYLGLHRGIEFE